MAGSGGNSDTAAVIASVAVRDESNYYITSVMGGAKRNPDLLIPGGAIKGHSYLTKLMNTAKEDISSHDDVVNPVVATETIPVKSEDEGETREDMFSKLQQ